MRRPPPNPGGGAPGAPGAAGAPRPALLPPPRGPGCGVPPAATLRASISFRTTEPSPGSPTPLLAAPPRPPKPRPTPPAGGNAAETGRVTFAVMPQVEDELAI